MGNPSLESLLAHEDWVRGLALAIAGDVHAADDLAQDAWLAAAAGPHSAIASPRAWLARVMRNVASHRRREREMARRRERTTEPTSPSVADVVAREETRRTVVAAVLDLEPHYREAVLLRFYEDLPPREIAARLGVPVETVRTRLKRASTALRTALGRRGIDRPALRAIGPVATGGMWMSAQSKIVLAAACLLVSALLVWRLSIGDAVPEAPETVTPRASTEAHEPVVVDTKPVAADVQPDSRESPAAVIEPPPVPRDRAVWGHVRDARGRPIAGARVRVFCRDFEGGVAAERAIVDARTDDDGTYRLGPLVERGGQPLYLEASADAHFTDCRRVVPATTQDFVLGAGGRFVGRVVSSRREPCAEARVQLYRRVDPHARRPQELLVGSRTTDEQGRFAFGALRPGVHYATVSSDTHPPPRTRDIDIVIRADEETRHDFVVGAGVTVHGRVIARATRDPVAGVTVSLRRAPRLRGVTDADGRFEIRGVPSDARSASSYEVAGGGWSLSRFNGGLVLFPDQSGDTKQIEDIVVERFGRALGRVVDSAGAPVAGARVRLRGRRSKAEVVTGADGAFDIVGLDPMFANYQLLMVDADGFLPARVEVPAVSSGEVRDGIVVRLAHGARLRGRVVNDADEPLVEAEVSVFDESGVWRTRADAEGRYELALPPGTRNVHVVPRGAVETGASAYVRTTRRRVVIDPARPTVLDVRLARGGAVAGRVVDAAGRPLPDVVVRASPSHRHLKSRDGEYQSSDVRHAITGADGRFRIGGLFRVEGVYDVVATRSGYDKAWSWGITPDREPLALTMVRRSLLGGTVRGREGAPATEFWVEARRVGGVKSRRGRTVLPTKRWFTALDGAFAFPVRAGDYDVVAGTQRGDRSRSMRVTVRSGEDPAPIELALERGATIVGRVWSPLGRPAIDAQVVLLPVATGGTRDVCATRVDRDGRFRLTAQESGTVVLRAFDRTEKTWEAIEVVAVDRGRSTEVRVQLGPVGALRVDVVDEAGQPAANARVVVRRPDGVVIAPLLHRYAREVLERRLSVRNFHYTHGRGTILPRRLAPGRYVVEATKPGYRAGTTHTIVHPGTDTTATVRITKK